MIDVSGSMRATDVKPSRLAAAQNAVRSFLKKVPHNVRVALIAFAGDPQVAAPPTTDLDVVRQGLDASATSAATGERRSATRSPRRSARSIQNRNGKRHARSYTDRRTPQDEHARLDPLPLRRPPDPRLLQPLEGAGARKAAGIPVYTIALGTPNGVLPGPGRLRGGWRPVRPGPDPRAARSGHAAPIAQTTGGKFFDARSAGAVESAYSHLGSSLGRTSGRVEITDIFLAIGAALLVAAVTLSALWSPRLP